MDRDVHGLLVCLIILERIVICPLPPYLKVKAIVRRPMYIRMHISLKSQVQSATQLLCSKESKTTTRSADSGFPGTVAGVGVWLPLFPSETPRQWRHRAESYANTVLPLSRYLHRHGLLHCVIDNVVSTPGRTTCLFAEQIRCYHE
ncbi:hypothetical protein BDU57DRAFT_192338 [Ampelomyces quisqualis]|uniref:Uncharacterized protein n=1 Tax=Ampelomyces quisqualis TaxID=50730 RepID=A0A6A5QUG7_AMPQU|nr:hypothetical protein BDU57DRAFT_192338 [Ampelomyces quisqualis]